MWARPGETMANGWTLNSMLERLRAELDATVQFWLQYSHDKECGSVFVTYQFQFRSRDFAKIVVDFCTAFRARVKCLIRSNMAGWYVGKCGCMLNSTIPLTNIAQ